MKTYTKQEIDNGMRRLFTSLKTPSIKTTIDGVEFLKYDTLDGKFNMLVRLQDGSFFGYEEETKELCAPYGQIQSIKGM